MYTIPKIIPCNLLKNLMLNPLFFIKMDLEYYQKIDSENDLVSYHFNVTSGTRKIFSFDVSEASNDEYYSLELNGDTRFRISELDKFVRGIKQGTVDCNLVFSATDGFIGFRYQHKKNTLTMELTSLSSTCSFDYDISQSQKKRFLLDLLGYFRLDLIDRFYKLNIVDDCVLNADIFK
jgi:hypothetical protein